MAHPSIGPRPITPPYRGGHVRDPSFLALPPTPLENTSQKSAGWNYPPEGPPRLSARREGGGAPSRPRGRTPMLPPPTARCDSARNPASEARLNFERAALTTRISARGGGLQLDLHTTHRRPGELTLSWGPAIVARSIVQDSIHIPVIHQSTARVHARAEARKRRYSIDRFRVMQSCTPLNRAE